MKTAMLKVYRKFKPLENEEIYLRLPLQDDIVNTLVLQYMSVRVGTISKVCWCFLIFLTASSCFSKYMILVVIFAATLLIVFI